MSKITTWMTNCKKCNEPIYYNPAKLLLESKDPFKVTNEVRVISLKCCGNCQITTEYEFPKNFIKYE